MTTQYQYIADQILQGEKNEFSVLWFQVLDCERGTMAVLSRWYSKMRFIRCKHEAMPNKICKEKTKKDIAWLRNKIITYKDQKYRERKQWELREAESVAMGLTVAVAAENLASLKCFLYLRLKTKTTLTAEARGGGIKFPSSVFPFHSPNPTPRGNNFSFWAVLVRTLNYQQVFLLPFPFPCFCSNLPLFLHFHSVLEL